MRAISKAGKSGKKGANANTLRRVRWLALAIAIVLVPTVVTPLVSAQTSDTSIADYEVVVSLLDESGNVAEVEHHAFIRASGEGDVDVRDPAILKNVVGAPAPRTDGTNLVHSGTIPGARNPADFYHRGDANLLDGQGLVQTPNGPRRLPAKISTTYTFEGEEIGEGQKIDNLAEIAGRGGQFEMEITVENVSGLAEEVTYKDSTSGKDITDVGFTFVPLTVQTGPLVFDDKTWKDIEVENALVTRSEGATQITSTAVLFPPTTPATQTIKISGVTSGFDLNSGRISVTPGVGAEQPQSIKDAQEKGGGSTKILYDALHAFNDGFLQLTDEDAGLPFAADAADRIMKEGVFVLRDTLAETASSLEESLAPSLIEFADGLSQVRDGIRDTLAATGVAGVRDFIGTTDYFEPICRDLPINETPGKCRFGLKKWFLPPLPPNEPLKPEDHELGVAETTGIAANADTSGATIDESSDLEGVTYSTEKVTRSTQGDKVGDFVLSSPQEDGTHLGSLYNWVGLLLKSHKTETDADQDGTPDYGPFVWPDPDDPSYQGLYTSAALDVTAARTGEMFPGSTAEGGPASNAFVAEFCKKIASMNDAPGLNEIDPVTGQDKGAIATCGNVPFADVTVRDLLKDEAWEKINDIVIRLDLVDIGDEPSQAMSNAIAKLEAQRDRAPTWALKQMYQSVINTLKQSGFASLPMGVALEIPLPLGKALVGGSNFGIHNALKNPSTEYLQGFIVTENADGSESRNQVVNLAVKRSACLEIGGDFQISLGSLLGVDCAITHFGPLGTNEIALTVMSNFLSSTGWNFDNYWRGDPGYQSTDLGIVGTGPKLYEVMNIMALNLDRASALCPSTLVTSKDGSGTPRVVPPKLDTPCDSVAPVTDPSDADDTSIVAIFNELFIPGVGESDDVYDDEGSPANLRTAVAALIEGLGKTAPEKLGDGDPANAGITLSGSLAALRDGLTDASEALAPAVAGTPLLIGGVGAVQIAGDFNTAVSKRGLERAGDYTTFMGEATYDGGEADGQVIFVFETVGVKK